VKQWLARALDEPRETYLLGLLRVGLGVLSLSSALKALRILDASGYFGEYFHVPLVPEAWVPSAAVYRATLWAQLALALLVIVGRFARPALMLGAVLGFLPFVWDRLGYHNNRYLLCLLEFILALAPCDRSFVLGQRLPVEQRKGPLFAQQLLKLQVSLVYLASAGSKLLDADWRGGQVLHVRYEQGIEYLSARGHSLPSLVQELLSAFWFAEGTSKAAIFTELALAVALWLPRTRVAALWLGGGLHLGIELFARVESFSYLMCTAYLAFVVPELRERRFEYDPDEPRAARLARLARWLDWLARIEFVAVPKLDAPAGLRIRDRDGAVYQGQQALVSLFRALPLLFPFLPLAKLWRGRG